MFSHFLENGASACLTVTWENKCHNHEHTPFLLLSLSCIAEHDPFGQFGSASQLLAHLQATCWEAEWEKKKGLEAVQQMLNNSQNMSVLSTLLITGLKHSTIQAPVKKKYDYPN